MRLLDGQDKLIESIKKRPVLYSKYHPQFTDRKLKQELWYEVCADIITNWSELSRGKRGEVVKEIQRKWKTLRDGFSRELSFQKLDRMKRAKGEYVRRRKKYSNFNKLKFLLAHKKKEDFDETTETQEGNDSDSDEQSEASNKEESTDSAQPFKVEPGTSSYYVDVDVDNIYTKSFDNQNSMASSIGPLGLDGDKPVEEDEDKLFCLSLVSGFKKMTEKEKYEARIRIMQVLSDIRFKNDELQSHASKKDVFESV